MQPPPPVPPSKSTGMEDSVSVSGSEPGEMGAEESKEKNQSMDMLEAGDCVSKFFGSFFVAWGHRRHFFCFSLFYPFCGGCRT